MTAEKGIEGNLEMVDHHEDDFQTRVAKSLKAAAKKVVPAGALEEVQRYRSYGKVERPIYAKIRLSEGIGLIAPKRARTPKAGSSFVFVCFGNIMRSPMCEALMRRTMAGSVDKELTITSAGLNATPGREAHPWAIEAAREFGVTLQNHHAKLLTDEMVETAEVVFVMDYQNQVQFVSRHPKARSKLFMLSAYAGRDYPHVEIRDPYYEGLEGTRNCYRVLDACIHNLALSLNSNRV